MPQPGLFVSADVLDKTVSLSKKPVIEVPAIRVDQSEESLDAVV